MDLLKILYLRFHKIELSEKEIIDLILYIQDNLIKSTDVEEYKFDFYYEYFINYSEEIYNEKI